MTQSASWAQELFSQLLVPRVQAALQAGADGAHQGVAPLAPRWGLGGVVRPLLPPASPCLWVAEHTVTPVTPASSSLFLISDTWAW